MNREIDILNYWTSIIKNTEEFQQIAVAENPEFNELTNCINRLLLDAFIQDATEYGVKRWENILNIVPVVGESLEDRKIRILTYLNIKLPYTMIVLENSIRSIVGENNYTMEYNNQLYTLNIKVNVDNLVQFHDIKNFIEKVVPQNIIVNLTRGEI